MSGTNRQITRRPPLSAPRGPQQTGLITSPSRIETLKRMVAAGQYNVNARFLAAKIFRAAGIKVPE